MTRTDTFNIRTNVAGYERAIQQITEQIERAREQTIAKDPSGLADTPLKISVSIKTGV